jgi:hypothetical protein
LPCRGLEDDPVDPGDPDGPEDPDEPAADEADPPEPAPGTGIGGRFSRSCGMSGGGIGGWPLISNGPLALFSNVAQPPLPKVEPMLQATSRLPADQLGSDTVL